MVVHHVKKRLEIDRDLEVRARRVGQQEPRVLRWHPGLHHLLVQRPHLAEQLGHLLVHTRLLDGLRDRVRE